jgi:hypothetical protein
VFLLFAFVWLGNSELMIAWMSFNFEFYYFLLFIYWSIWLNYPEWTIMIRILESLKSKFSNEDLMIEKFLHNCVLCYPKVNSVISNDVQQLVSDWDCDYMKN